MAVPFNTKCFKDHPRPAKGEPAFVQRQAGVKYNTAWFRPQGVSLGIDITFDKDRYKEVLCHWPESSLTEFYKLAEARIKAIKSGKKKHQKMTLAEFVEEFVLPEIASRNRDLKGFEKRLKKILKCFGNADTSLIDAIDIDRFLNELSRTLKGSSVNRVHSALSRIFSVAVRLGFRDDNPCSRVLRRPESQPRDRVLNDNEIFHFVGEALRLDSFQSLALLVALFTGLRIGNVIEITRSMFNDDFTVLTLPMTKNGRSYRVFLNGPTRWVLELCAERSWNQFLFPSSTNDGRSIASPRKAQERIREYVAVKTGIHEHWVINDLRSTYATKQLELTGDIRLVQQNLFHSSSTVTERYSYHQNPQLAAASERTAQSFLTGCADSFQQLKEINHAG